MICSRESRGSAAKNICWWHRGVESTHNFPCTWMKIGFPLQFIPQTSVAVEFVSQHGASEWSVGELQINWNKIEALCINCWLCCRRTLKWEGCLLWQKRSWKMLSSPTELRCLQPLPRKMNLFRQVHSKETCIREFESICPYTRVLYLNRCWWHMDIRLR